MSERITVVKRKWNVVWRSVENTENQLANVKKKIDGCDILLVDRLSGLKNSHEDKIKKVKLSDEEL